MKKTLICALLAMIFSASQAWAQTNRDDQDESLAGKVSTIVRKAKSSMQRAGRRLEKVIGINEKGREGDEVKINGTYYMPIYSLNIYNGQDAEKFRKTCEKMYAKKYPKTSILSVTIPQEGWVSETVKDGSKVIGYLQYMYCYVLAKDGTAISTLALAFNAIRMWAKIMARLTDGGRDGIAPTCLRVPFTMN